MKATAFLAIIAAILTFAVWIAASAPVIYRTGGGF